MLTFGQYVNKTASLYLTLLCLNGCYGIKSPSIQTSDALPRPGAKITISGIKQTAKIPEDSFSSISDAKPASEIDAPAMLLESMQTALKDEELLSAVRNGDFLLSLEIVDYDPGNVFKRFVAGGAWGETMLTVRGSLIDPVDGRQAALILYSRTTRPNSLFEHRHLLANVINSIGAWKTIFSRAAMDIAHDLKLQIERGKGLLVSLPAWPGPQISAPQTVKPTGYLFTRFIDRRTQPERIGERQAAFGMRMGDLFLNRKPVEFLQEALSTELAANGKLPAESAQSGAVVEISAQLDKFWVHTDATPLYWDVIGEIGLKLIVKTLQTDQPATERNYSCLANERTYIWPSEDLVAQVLGQCVNELMSKVRTNELFAL